MYSSKSMRISFRLVSTFTDRVSGEEPMNRGGGSSFGPPEGEPWRAQERIQKEIKKNTKKRIEKNCCKLIKNQTRSEEHTSELQSRENLVFRLLLKKKKI